MIINLKEEPKIINFAENFKQLYNKEPIIVDDLSSLNYNPNFVSIKKDLDKQFIFLDSNSSTAKLLVNNSKKLTQILPFINLDNNFNSNFSTNYNILKTLYSKSPENNITRINDNSDDLSYIKNNDFSDELESNNNIGDNLFDINSNEYNNKQESYNIPLNYSNNINYKNNNNNNNLGNNFLSSNYNKSYRNLENIVSSNIIYNQRDYSIANNSNYLGNYFSKYKRKFC